MASFAVLLGIAALVLALAGRIEQRRLNKQIERLRDMVFRQQAQPPARPKPTTKQAPHTTAQHGVGARIQPAQPAPAKPTEEVHADTLDEVSTPKSPTPASGGGPDTVLTDALNEVQPKRDDVTKPVAPDHRSLPDASTAQPDKKETLHRLTSASHTEAKRPPFAPPGIAKPTAKPVLKSAPKPKPKAPSISLEERLGAGVYIWIGGIALMLAGAFLVKYSFDNNLLSLQARLAIAGAFGATLVLASLWLHSRADKVAAAVCGAGVADLFATVLAASAYYRVIDPWWGFVMMALVTAVAVVMSLKHGRFVALLGLVGGFATPTLISGNNGAWEVTFTYLLLLEVGLTVITRKKQWFGLAALTLLASVITTLVYTLFSWEAGNSLWLVMFAMGTAVVFVVNAARAADQEEGSPTWMSRIWLGIGAVGTSALLMTMFVGYSHFSMMELSALGLLGAGALVLARLDRRYITLAYLGAGLCGMMLLAWPVAHRIGQAELDSNHYYLLAIGYGLTFFVGGLLCVWRNARPGMFAWLSSASALVFVILAHLGQEEHLPGELAWWMVYTLVAAFVTIAAAVVWRTREKHGTLAIDAYAIMATALATFAIWFGLDHPWVAPAWCGLAVVVAALGMRLNLRWLVIPTGWLTVGCVSQLIFPGVFDYDMPMRPIANTMLAHYGLPALGFAAIAWVYHRDPWVWLRRVFQALALVTATITVSLQIRLWLHPQVLWENAIDLVEWSTYAGLWIAVGAGVLWRYKAASLEGLRQAAIGIGVIGLITVVLHPLLIANPLLAPSDVGQTLIFNWLLYIYGLPCVLAFLFARVLPREAGPYKNAAGRVSFALLFALVTLEVRHGFMGQDMRLGLHDAVGLREWSTYSVAWVVISLTLVWVGRRLKSKPFETAAVVMGMAGLAAAVFGPLMMDNPLMKSADVGQLLILNWLLYIYGVPCVLAFVLAWVLPKETGGYKKAAAVVSFILLFAFVSFEVRHGFARQDMQLHLHNPVGLREWATYSVVWAAFSLSLAWVGRRFTSAPFNMAALVMGIAGLGAAVLGPLVIDNPLVWSADVGSWRVVNWLLYIYGVPCVLAFLLAQWLVDKTGVFKRAARAVSFILLFALISFEVRHGFTGTHMAWRLDNGVGLHEWATYSVAWLVASLAFVWLSQRWRYKQFEVAAVAMGLAGLVAALVGSLVIDNPLFYRADVGSLPALNWLLYIYGLPCVLTAALAYTSRTKLLPMKPIGVSVSLLLLFVLVSMQVRQGFVGGDLMLKTHEISSAENYSYSLAWVLLALSLLAGGLITKSTALRYGSLAVMLIAVGKVAVDTAQLKDLWRVLSLLGLGLSLIVLGYVYQRYVFRRPDVLETEPDEPAALQESE